MVKIWKIFDDMRNGALLNLVGMTHLRKYVHAIILDHGDSRKYVHAKSAKIFLAKIYLVKVPLKDVF